MHISQDDSFSLTVLKITMSLCRSLPENRWCNGDARQFQCDSGECIPVDWVCDGNEQCGVDISDNSDEEIGCNLYPGKLEQSAAESAKSCPVCPRVGISILV